MKVPKIELKRRGESGMFWVRYSFHGERPHYSLGTVDKAHALERVEEIKAEIRLGIHRPFKKLIFDNLWERYKEEEWPDKAPSSRKRDQTSIKYLLAEFGGKPINEITFREQVRTYRTKRLNGQLSIQGISKKEKVSKYTVNREVALLKRMTNLATHEWNWLRSDPLHSFSMFTEPKRVRPIPPEEWQRLLSAASPEFRDFLIIARFTGIRSGISNHGILGLTWNDIDLNDWKILVRSSKTGEGRIVYIDDTVHKVFSKRKTQATSKWLFSGKNGNRRYSFNRAFTRAKKRAGIKNLRIHDIRHAFGSDKKSQGADLTSLAKLMGHKSIKTTMRYGEPNEEHLRKIMKSRPKSSKKDGPKVDQIED